MPFQTTRRSRPFLKARRWRRECWRSGGSQIREYLPFAVAQLVVGITAGLFVSMVEGSGVVNLVDSAGGVGVISFVVGYSEAAFLGLVGNIAKTPRLSGSDSVAAP